MVAATGLIASAAMGALLWRATRPVDRPLMRFHLDLGPDAVRGPHNTVAISPDGTRIVYPVRSGTMTLLATRLLDQPKATTLRDTESGIDPFFSPDGQWIGFFNNESLRKTPVQGGASVTLARGLSGPRGGAWGPNGEIIADLDNSRLERIPITGGNRQTLAALPPQFQERTWRWPQFLPGGDMFLFTGSLGVGYGNGYDDANIEVLSLKSGQRTVVANQVGYYGRYLPSGHLVYIHEGVLFAVPFNPATLKTRGTPLPVVDDVSASAGQGAGQFDFSQTGTFVYTSGKPNLGARMLSWMGPDGKTEPAFTASAAVLSPVLSPDGKLLAMGSGQIVVVDLQRRVETPLTSGSIRRIPAWAPDGKHLVYSHGERESAIWWIRADGSGGAQKLFESKDRVTADSISADGKYLAFSLQPAMGESHIWILPLDLRDSEHPVAGTPQRFVQEPDSQTFATFSPDGRWIAYQEVSSGTPNVFVRPFPANPTAGKWKISVNGGRHPVWSRTAKQLLYEGALRVQVVDYTIKGSVFEPGQTRRWSDGEITAMGTARNFDLSPDGKRIICAPVTADPSEGLHVTLLLNFFDELKRRLP